MEPVFLDSPAAIIRHLLDFIDVADMTGPGVRFVLCDKKTQVVVHVHVDDVSPQASAAECGRTVGLVARTVAEHGDGAMVLALTRAGPPILTQADRRWFRAASRACHEHGVRLLGVHVVTPRGLREVVVDDAL